MSHDSRRYFERQLRRKAGSAIRDFCMIRPGDRILVALSGGRDSLVMLKVLCDLQRAAPVSFELVAVYVATGFEHDFPRIAHWVQRELGLEVTVIESHIAAILREMSDPDKSACALCSRLRRGVLYRTALAMGASSIALGHHRDDILETFVLRCLYTGQIGAMAPARVSNDGKNRIIRPLAYCPGDLVERYFAFLGVEPVQYSCPIRPDSKRDLVRRYLDLIEQEIPRARDSLFASLGNIDMKSMCIREDDHADNH